MRRIARLTAVVVLPVLLACRPGLSAAPTGEPATLATAATAAGAVAIISTAAVSSGDIPANGTPTIEPAATAATANLPCPLFPADNVWNTPIDHLSVHPLSEAYIDTIGRNEDFHPDFGSGIWPPDDGGPIGIPYVIIPANQPKVPVDFYYPDESDPGPYPIPPDAPIEGGPDSGGDRHILIVQEGTCLLYEIYDAHPRADGGWDAGSGAVKRRAWAISPAATSS